MLISTLRPVQPKSVCGINQFVIYDYLCFGREIDAIFYLSLSNFFIFTKYFFSHDTAITCLWISSVCKIAALTAAVASKSEILGADEQSTHKYFIAN